MNQDYESILNHANSLLSLKENYKAENNYLKDKFLTLEKTFNEINEAYETCKLENSGFKIDLELLQNEITASKKEIKLLNSVNEKNEFEIRELNEKFENEVSIKEHQLKVNFFFKAI